MPPNISKIIVHPKGRIPKRWDKNLVQEILLIEGYLHISTFYSGGGVWRCTEVHRGAWRCVEVHGGVRRCAEGCTRWCTSCERPGRQKSGSRRGCTGAWKLEIGKI